LLKGATTSSYPTHGIPSTEARIKSDRVDSKVFTELLRLNSLPLGYILQPNISQIKEKARQRAFLV